MSAQPPRLAARLLGVLLPADVSEEAFDDLNDLYNARLTSLGRAAADGLIGKSGAVSE
ncbi:MAG: hypothetical protein ACREOG_10110 [Gemmatimonadaceae bacterium]